MSKLSFDSFEEHGKSEARKGQGKAKGDTPAAPGTEQPAATGTGTEQSAAPATGLPQQCCGCKLQIYLRVT